jgi:hypothetical protein
MCLALPKGIPYIEKGRSVLPRAISRYLAMGRLGQRSRWLVYCFFWLAALIPITECFACATTPANAPLPSEEGCRNKDASSSSPAKDGAKPFDVASQKDFLRYEVALREYVTQTKSVKETDFCIVGFAREGIWRKAWVLWPQGDRIFEWGGGESKIASLQEINLKTDVVSSESEIKGSTYLVTQEWVSRLRDACNCFGRKVHITRQRTRKEGDR